MTQYTLTIHIAAPGTPLSDGHTSNAGHLWYEINRYEVDSFGQQNITSNSYGFAPLEHKGSVVPTEGYVYTNDTNKYLETYSSRTLQITENEFNKLDSFGKDPYPNGFEKTYWAPTNSCIDFVWKALEYAGMNPAKHEGSLLPISNRDDLQKFMELPQGEQQKIIQKLDELFPISAEADKRWSESLTTELQLKFNLAKQTQSPIVLDLNGDGVQTTALSKSSTSGVHFNLDAKGFAENTGWVNGQDGLLVRDLDGDGKITNGRELFGNHTLLTQGLNTGKEAANGFEALQELDDNHDGIVDSKDREFNTLKVWKDTNGDGVTNDGELLTLSQAGVKNLNVGYLNIPTIDLQGNAHQQLGNFTKTDGTTQKMEDVWFAVDTARSVDQTQQVAVSDDILALPDLAGMGNISSLHQAMAKDSTGELKALVAQWIASNENDRNHVLDQIIYHWTGVQNVEADSRFWFGDNGLGESRHLAALEAFLGETYQQGSSFEQKNNPQGNASIIVNQTYEFLKSSIASSLYWQTDGKEVLNSISMTWNESQQTFNLDASGVYQHMKTVYLTDPNIGLQQIMDMTIQLSKDSNESRKSVLNSVFQSAQNDTSDFGTFTTSLMKPVVIGSVSSDQLVAYTGSWFRGLAGDDFISGSRGDDVLEGGAGNDTLLGNYGNDTYLFSRGGGQDNISEYDATNNNDTLRLINLKPADVTVVREVNAWGYSTHLLVKVNGSNDFIRVNDFYGSSSAQIEQLIFADGTIWDSNKLNTLPIIATGAFVSGTNGDDVIDLTNSVNTTSNAYGQGNDTYLFSRGAGHDVINENSYTTNNDVVRLVGLNQNDVVFSREADEYGGSTILQIQVKGSEDTLRINNFYTSTQYQIEHFQFADGTVLDSAVMFSLPVLVKSSFFLAQQEMIQLI